MIKLNYYFTKGIYTLTGIKLKSTRPTVCNAIPKWESLTLRAGKVSSENFLFVDMKGNR